MKKKKLQVDTKLGTELQPLGHQPPEFETIHTALLDNAAYPFLHDAALQLAASLDYETTLTMITRLAIPALADSCLVDLLTTAGRVCRVATVHANPAEARLLKEELRYPPDPDALDHPVAKVLRTRQPELHYEITDRHLQATAHDAEHLRILRELGPTSGMVVPLIAQDQLLGALSLGTVRGGRHYTDADLAVAQAFADHAAVALLNARRYKEAQDGMRAREQFLSIAAHELKNPLTTLLGSIEHLQRRITRMSEAQERDHQIAQRIRDQTVRMTQMIDTLLDISRVESGRLNLVRAPIDLAALIRRLVAEVQATNKQHTFGVEVLDDPLIVYADAIRLEQVLQNLLVNAVKYSPGGGPIGVRLARRGLEASIAVTDQGIGIPQAAIPYLFERFFRAPNADKLQIDGLGLGLAVVREIVTHHGGEVSVASEEGQGSTFAITIPLYEAGFHAPPEAERSGLLPHSFEAW
ncbi:MAG TPA: GAF domain-containing sensor histidine kinase [Herpetosiphonaceae bacterium]